MKMRKPTLWVGMAALVAAFFMAVWWMRPEPRDAPIVPPEPTLFSFVRSLDGTRPDGDIKVAAGDALVVDAELGHLFDYYLSAIGEKSLESIRAEAESELDRRLKPAAAAEAKRLLASYLDYKRKLLEIEKRPQIVASPAATVRARLTTMQQTRSRYFSPKEAEGLFGFGDAYDMDAVSRLEITEDKTLNEVEKKEKLAALDAAMSPAIRNEREAPLKILRLDESTQQLRAKGASEHDIYRMRATATSPEAAARLAEVDQEEITWKNRIASYLAERKAVIGNAGSSSEADRALALVRLREVHFNADEQKRLAAYE